MKRIAGGDLLASTLIGFFFEVVSLDPLLA